MQVGLLNCFQTEQEFFLYRCRSKKLRPLIYLRLTYTLSIMINTGVQTVFYSFYAQSLSTTFFTQISYLHSYFICTRYMCWSYFSFHTDLCNYDTSLKISSCFGTLRNAWIPSNCFCTQQARAKTYFAYIMQ